MRKCLRTRLARRWVKVNPPAVPEHVRKAYALGIRELLSMPPGREGEVEATRESSAGRKPSPRFEANPALWDDSAYCADCAGGP